MFLHVDSEDSEADLSLRWAQSSFCWFCHEAAHLMNRVYTGACITKSLGYDIVKEDFT